MTDYVLPSPHKFNIVSILNNHLSCTVAIIFAVWGTEAKGAYISFSFFPTSLAEDSGLTMELSNLSIEIFFLSLVSQECSTFYIKEALYDFSLLYPNCQHRSNLTSYCVEMLNKTMIHIWSETEKDVLRFHHAIQNSSKLVNFLFLEFSILKLQKVNLQKAKPWLRGVAGEDLL